MLSTFWRAPVILSEIILSLKLRARYLGYLWAVVGVTLVFNNQPTQLWSTARSRTCVKLLRLLRRNGKHGSLQLLLPSGNRPGNTPRYRAFSLLQHLRSRRAWHRTRRRQHW